MLRSELPNAVWHSASLQCMACLEASFTVKLTWFGRTVLYPYHVRNYGLELQCITVTMGTLPEDTFAPTLAR